MNEREHVARLMEKAEESLDVARSLTAEGHHGFAASRAYYAIHRQDPKSAKNDERNRRWTQMDADTAGNYPLLVCSSRRAVRRHRRESAFIGG